MTHGYLLFQPHLYQFVDSFFVTMKASWYRNHPPHAIRGKVPRITLTDVCLASSACAINQAAPSQPHGNQAQPLDQWGILVSIAECAIVCG